MLKNLPKPGEYWYRADGSKGGITILDVAHYENGVRIPLDMSSEHDPWVKYQYDDGQIHEKNWCGFMARFMPTENGWPKQ